MLFVGLKVSLNNMFDVCYCLLTCSVFCLELRILWNKVCCLMNRILSGLFCFSFRLCILETYLFIGFRLLVYPMSFLSIGIFLMGTIMIKQSSNVTAAVNGTLRIGSKM